MNTYNTSIFPYFSFTNKLVLRGKVELYMTACSHNPALWQPESSQSRQKGIRKLAASFLRGRGCPKAVAAKSNFSDFREDGGIFRIV